MYIQLTTRCNMTCERCYSKCNKGGGEDMSSTVFDRALDLSISLGLPVMFSGGEPTLHKDFWLFLNKALDKPAWKARMDGVESTAMRIQVITNGALTNTALKLAAMAREGKFVASLSLDRWHDPIDSRVLHAFLEGRETSPYLIRSNDFRLVKTYPTIDAGKFCPCTLPIISPNGEVRACGCFDAPICGHILQLCPNDLINELHSCSRGRYSGPLKEVPPGVIEEITNVITDAIKQAGLTVDFNKPSSSAFLA